MTRSTSVVVGLGQIGSAFAHALLRAGHAVVPVNRGDDVPARAAAVPAPAHVVVALGEAGLDEWLAGCPDGWREALVLVQNELLPPDWRRHGLEDPTVASVWFEKKANKKTTVLLPTPIAGPGAEGLAAALNGVGYEAEPIPREALTDALVTKNLYILTSNVAGLEAGGGTVGELWATRRDGLLAVARDVLALQRARLAAGPGTGPGDAAALALTQAQQRLAHAQPDV
ncbi:MAG: hypothetical protein AAF447_25100, partial [Myxococcota bacterium]